MLFVIKTASVVEKIYFLLENNDKNVDFGVFFLTLGCLKILFDFQIYTNNFKNTIS